MGQEDAVRRWMSSDGQATPRSPRLEPSGFQGVGRSFTASSESTFAARHVPAVQPAVSCESISPGTQRNKINHRTFRPLEEPEPLVLLDSAPFEEPEPMDRQVSTTWSDAASLAALRGAMREELRDFLEGSLLREVIRNELTLTAKDVIVPELKDALESVTFEKCAGSVLFSQRGSAMHTSELEGESDNKRKTHNIEDSSVESSSREGDAKTENRFSTMAESWNSKHAAHALRTSRDAQSDGWSLERLRLWWMRLEEPIRSGMLAGIATSHSLETMVNIIILLDVAFMIYRADRALSEPGSTCGFCMSIDWMFQIIYTTALLLNVASHRLWFFCNREWKQNWFDVFLVLSGYASMMDQKSAGAFVRVLRLLRLGKALRALKVMTRVKHLRTFVVCIQGSLSPFFWALVMLCVLFMIFSLFFVQIVAGHIEDESVGLSGDMEDMFGSVLKSMLTLFRATTGGDDWSIAFNVICKTGWMGGIIYLFVIAFVQLSMINIITGIFVEAAMETLAPDIETVAMQRIEKEQEFARDLERLCKLVDADESGKLTPEQFEDGMTKGRIPMLLTMLGLREDHVLKFFKEMSALRMDDGGQVDIHEFVVGCMDLKGPGTHFDMQMILAELEEIKGAHARHLRDIKGQLRQLNPSKRIARSDPDRIP